ncbi:cytochrome c oxidase assembly factor 1 family protein [Flavobacterium sp. LS1R49]|uniref:Cytochrome c oxidase assembly factor 1 family protein n=1 Tax=Flavobacterium shii TaxID=2987687 RepID=A0A9X2YXI0_9FLAO|nr:cytochrome c oxidase assembly factor 1 family protein [Flavobacterium shii]MCV9929974.1 cytochrome c oxidase assembly factor 1 family protein [Flavobacterium shii]
MEDSNTLIIRKNWWDRNWKWFVPTGCLGILVIFGLFIAGIFFGITSMMKGSDAYKEAMTEAQQNKLVIEKLGSPIEDDGMTSGSINVQNDSGNCDLQIPIKGPKGKGTLFIVAEKRGNWKYSEMTVFIKATKEEIDLLKNKTDKNLDSPIHENSIKQ